MDYGLLTTDNKQFLVARTSPTFEGLSVSEQRVVQLG